MKHWKVIFVTVLLIISSITTSSAMSVEEAKTTLNQHQNYLDAVSVSSTTPKISAKLVNGEYVESISYTEEEPINLPQLTNIQEICNFIYKSLDYDYTFTISSAYEGLRNGKGVCQAYSNLFTMLCEQASIKTVKVRGYIGQTFHVVNIIESGIVYDTTYGDVDVSYCNISLEEYCSKTGFIPSINWNLAWSIKYSNSINNS